MIDPKAGTDALAMRIRDAGKVERRRMAQAVTKIAGYVFRRSYMHDKHHSQLTLLYK